MNIWLCDLTYDQQVVASDTMPTNIGYLACYLASNSTHTHAIRLFKYPGKLIEAIQRDGPPDLVGFSHFMWNSRLNYRFAERLKAARRDTVVVFGGLNYPAEAPRQQRWFSDHPAVDFHVYKEGEVAFHSLVEALEAAGRDVCTVKEHDLPGTHFLRQDGSLHAPQPAPRVRDLSSFPSPFLTGLLDEFFDGRLMPLLTTNRGCPFSCTFCAEGVLYYSKVNRFTIERVREDIDYIGRKIASLDYPRKDMYISDSNFGMYREDLDVAAALKNAKERYGWPQYITATTGKNNKERVLSVARILDGGMSLTASVQSLDGDVLSNIKRKNINADALLSTAISAAEVGADSYSDIILGLPGDSLRAHEETLRQVINAKLDWVLPYQLRLQEDTEMTTEASRRQFGLKSHYRILKGCCGNYAFGPSDTLSVAEIEEVCVEGSNLPFNDYLQARILHLVIAIFYNDGFFSGMLKLLDRFDIERYVWVKDICRVYPEFAGLRRLFEQFLKETKDELWERPEDLARFLSSAETIAKCIDGELGANLLGKYRILAITGFIDDIFAVAKVALLSCISARQGPTSDATRRLIDELAAYERECKRDLFVPNLEDTTLRFSHDIPRLLNDQALVELGSYVLPATRSMRFFRTAAMNDVIGRNQKVFGSSVMGRYKQLTRTPTKSLYRLAQWDDVTHAARAQGAAAGAGS